MCLVVAQLAVGFFPVLVGNCGRRVVMVGRRGLCFTLAPGGTFVALAHSVLLSLARDARLSVVDHPAERIRNAANEISKVRELRELEAGG